MNTASVSETNGKRLSCLLDGLLDISQADDVHIDNLCLDSRDVNSGSLFFAVPGSREDGRSHIRQALQSGAGAVLYETQGWTFDGADESRVLGVTDLRRHIGPVADIFYDRPSSKMHVVGLTGTNGKSTCAMLTAQALTRLGSSCGVIGTLGYGFPDELAQSSLTTPDPISLQQNLATLVHQHAQYVCLEVSSHSLDQARNEGVRFGTVVFTNLTRDHLDYHRTEENYRASKSKLFTESSAACAVLNIDDVFGRSLVDRSTAERNVTYGSGDAEVRLVDCLADIDGVSLGIGIDGRTITVRSHLLGRVNAMNILTVAAVLHALQFDVEDIERGLMDLRPIPGRMERFVGTPGQPTVFVDYAHTPDGLENALTSLRELTRGRLWCVFGCGGDRDADKRPMMGAIAERYADRIVVTDDNPRNESPAGIAGQIMQGMRSKHQVIHERGDAIRHAIDQAEPLDTVLIAGKGHETTQTYRNEIRSFSDRNFVSRLMGSEA
ncbi:MAG: UDP-N-acetylmuramoyl-L-alanyl-D-glutamate--2,6-diaminopimelate ligase [Acidiferrobacterales bacterium]|nr:UDP-N-acetylmuramoyl-L-alanyl-D-glutamate--2,6-diaminopimelate ligase [Acidiferrobacterales bacterium]